MKPSKIFLVLVTILLSIGCAFFVKIKLRPSVAYSLTIGTNQGIPIVQSAQSLSGVPTEYYIQKKLLYIADQFRNRVLVYNRDNQLQFQMTNQNKKELHLIYEGSNQVLQPFENNNDLHTLYIPGKIIVNDQYIYIENKIFMQEEEEQVQPFSFILKYNKNGKFVDVLGMKSRNNKLYPFSGLEKLTLDLKNNLFIYLKNDEQWSVKKINPDGQIIYDFNSYTFFTNQIIPKEKDKKIMIEDIDHSNDGDFLIILVTYYEKNFIFDKVVYYRLDLKTNKIEKLFQSKNEKHNFILIDYSNLIYYIQTNPGADKEEVIVSLYNLNGKLIGNYLIEFNRKEALWLNVKIQKESMIIGLRIENDKLDIVRWK